MFWIMEKDGQRLVAHEVALEEMKVLGWNVIGPTANAEDDPWAKPKKSKKDAADQTDGQTVPSDQPPAAPTA